MVPVQPESKKAIMLLVVALKEVLTVLPLDRKVVLEAIRETIDHQEGKDDSFDIYVRYASGVLDLTEKTWSDLDEHLKKTSPEMFSAMEDLERIAKMMRGDTDEDA